WDVGAAVDFVLARRSIPRLHLIGWSWGTTLMAGFAARNPGKGQRVAPLPPLLVGEPGPPGPKARGPPPPPPPGGPARWVPGAPRWVAPRRPGGKEGRAHPRRLVRRLVERDAGQRSGRRRPAPAGPAGAERRAARHLHLLAGGQGAVRSGPDHGADDPRRRR